MNQYDDKQFFDAYAEMSRSKLGLKGAGEWHQMEKLFPDVKGKAVLDLGCGYGWHCKYAADKGAVSVTGIDQSGKMIAEAEKRNSDVKIKYLVCDIKEYEYPREAYSLVISNLVLHYISDLNEIYSKVYRSLKQGGIFLFNIEHPVFTSGVGQQFTKEGYWPVDNYYYPGERDTVFLGKIVKKQHHTLTEIIMGLINCGFIIEALEEAMPPEKWRAEMPEEMKRPMMLLVRARK